MIRSYHIALTGLQLREICLIWPQVLGLQACATIPSCSHPLLSVRQVNLMLIFHKIEQKL